MAKKEIWLPKSETRILIDDEGTLTMWDSMVMELKPLKQDNQTGFTDKKP
jgi:hypothetical protein